jgi:hypothetical protein
VDDPQGFQKVRVPDCQKCIVHVCVQVGFGTGSAAKVAPFLGYAIQHGHGQENGRGFKPAVALVAGKRGRCRPGVRRPRLDGALGVTVLQDPQEPGTLSEPFSTASGLVNDF